MLHIGMLIEKGLGTVQEAINETKLNDTECTIKCNQCNNNIQRMNEYDPYIFLDTSLITDPHYKSEIYFASTDSITKSIYLDDRHYTLCGIIHYISYDNNNSNENLR